MDSRSSFQLELLFVAVKGQFVPRTWCTRLPTEFSRCLPADYAYGLWNSPGGVPAHQIEEKFISVFS